MVNKKRGFRLLSLFVPNLVKFRVATSSHLRNKMVGIKQPLSESNKPQGFEVNLFTKERYPAEISLRPSALVNSDAVESVVVPLSLV